mgnify:CR=1 FL=1
MKNPKITVLMPVYNAKKFLNEAIDSILNQTFKNFEFLIINDASTDNSKQIILSYRDSRIIYYENKINLGVAKTLNIGLALTTSKYIARMDADDISVQNRLEKQVEFMEKNPQVAVCGTWLKLINNENNDIWQSPSDHKTIKSLSLFYSSLYHPTVLIRNDVLKRYHLSYNSSFKHVEDYELWVRIMENARVANLKEVLLFHRIHSNHVGTVYNHIQVKNANRVRIYQLNKLGIFPNPEELAVHQAISYWQFKPHKKFVKDAKLWLKKLFIANFKKNYYDQLGFLKVLTGKWFLIWKIKHY